MKFLLLISLFLFSTICNAQLALGTVVHVDQAGAVVVLPNGTYTETPLAKAIFIDKWKPRAVRSLTRAWRQARRNYRRK